MKKIITLLLALVMVLSLCACGNTPDETTEEPEATEEPDNSIPLRPFKMNAIFTNSETGDSFTLYSPVEEALLLFDNPFERSMKNYIDYENLGSDFETEIDFEDYYFDGQADGFIDSVHVYSDKWIFNDELQVGIPFEEICSKWGQAEESENSLIHSYSYYFSNEYMGACKIIIYCEADDNETICDYCVFPVDDDGTSYFDRYVPIPQYTSDELVVYDVSVSEPDSANGVDLSVSLWNLLPRTIKYITFTITPYNAVNDPVASEIGNESTKVFEFVGPFEQSQAIEKRIEENAWYNKNIDHVVIESIEVIYMDAPDVAVCYKIEE